MPGPFSLDDIQLPDEDKSKLADLDNEEEKDPPEQPTPDSEDKPEDTQDDKPTDDDSSDEPVSPNEDEGGETPEDKPEEEPEKPTPFHEHPDWKKMQEQVKAAEERAAAAERRAQQVQEPPKPDEYAGLTRGQIVEKIIVDKQKSGWKPKDQLEYDAAIEDAKERADKIQTQQQTTQQQRYESQVNEKFNSLGISDKAEQKKITEQVLAWANQGHLVSLNTFDIAAEQLKLKGEIGKQPEPTPTPEPEKPAKQAQQRQSQNSANKKISKSKSGGGDNKTDRPSFNYIRDNDLDSIILDQADKLG